MFVHLDPTNVNLHPNHLCDGAEVKTLTDLSHFELGVKNGGSCVSVVKMIVLDTFNGNPTPSNVSTNVSNS